MSDDKVIKSLQEGESHKYLGISEAGQFLEEKIMLNVAKEYIRRSRKVFESKLNAGNLVCEINTWGVSLYGALHPKSDVGRSYIPGKEGGRGLISIEHCVELAIWGLEVYVHEIEKRLIQAGRGDKKDGLETATILKRSKNKKRLKNLQEKVLHGQKLEQTKEIRSDHCSTWLQNRDLKRETKSFIVAAQNQSIRTNLVKEKIDKDQGDSISRLRRKVDENTDLIVSGCSKSAQKEYKRGHHNLEK